MGNADACVLFPFGWDERIVRRMTTITPQPTLHTPRLTVRPYVLTDAPELQRLAGAWEIADTTKRIPHPYPDGAADIWIAMQSDAWETQTAASFAIVDRANNQYMGGIGLSIVSATVSAELGYWLGVPYWGRGYCTEAARAILSFAFDALKLHRVAANYLTRNPASGRVMEKLGMQFEGVQRDGSLKWGKFEDIAVCAILEAEWTQLSNDLPPDPGTFAFTEEEVAAALAQSMSAHEAAALAKDICDGADASTAPSGDLLRR